MKLVADMKFEADRVGARPTNSIDAEMWSANTLPHSQRDRAATAQRQLSGSHVNDASAGDWSLVIAV